MSSSLYKRIQLKINFIMSDGSPEGEGEKFAIVSDKRQSQ